MKKLKKFCTWFIWCITSPIWGAALRYCKYVTVPGIVEIHEHFRNFLFELGILGEESRKFDFEVNERLRLLLYWASKHEGITLDMDMILTKSADNIVREINSMPRIGIAIQEEGDFFVFKYKTQKSDRWLEPHFPDGGIWGKELSAENERLAYLVNIMLNGRKEV